MSNISGSDQNQVDTIALGVEVRKVCWVDAYRLCNRGFVQSAPIAAATACSVEV